MYNASVKVLLFTSSFDFDGEYITKKYGTNTHIQDQSALYNVKFILLYKTRELQLFH